MAAPKFPEGLNVLSQPIIGVPDGTQAGHVASWSQLQAVIKGQDLKDPVRAISVTNITLSGTQTVDGVALAVGDRVLVAGQSTGADNGVYIVASGTWTRATDADESAEITKGFTLAVMEGTNKGTGAAQSQPVQYGLTNTTNPTVGTTALAFAPIGVSGASTLAGNGLTKVSNTIAVVAGNGIIADGTSTRVDPTVVTRKSASTLIGNGSATQYDITDNLNTQWKEIVVQDAATGERLFPGTLGVDANTSRVTTGAPLASNAWRVTVFG